MVAMLPWWAGVAIAVVGYLLLHRFATPAAITAVQPGQMSNLVAQAMVTTFASAGQYLVPLIGLIGAAISFFRRGEIGVRLQLFSPNPPCSVSPACAQGSMAV